MQGCRSLTDTPADEWNALLDELDRAFDLRYFLGHG